MKLKSVQAMNIQATFFQQNQFTDNQGDSNGVFQDFPIPTKEIKSSINTNKGILKQPRRETQPKQTKPQS